MALGQLAASSELTALRAVGLSRRRIEPCRGRRAGAADRADGGQRRDRWPVGRSAAPMRSRPRPSPATRSWRSTPACGRARATCSSTPRAASSATRRRPLAGAARRAPVRVRRRRPAGVAGAGQDRRAPPRRLVAARRHPHHVPGASSVTQTHVAQERWDSELDEAALAAGIDQPRYLTARRAAQQHRLPPAQRTGCQRVRGALLGALVLPVQRAGAVPGGDAVRVRHAAQRRPGQAPVHRHRVRAGLLAAADAVREAGRRVQVRLPRGLPDADADHAGRVVWLFRRRRAELRVARLRRRLQRTSAAVLVRLHVPQRAARDTGGRRTGSGFSDEQVESTPRTESIEPVGESPPRSAFGSQVCRRSLSCLSSSPSQRQELA